METRKPLSEYFLEMGTRYPVQSYMIYQPPIIKPMKNLADKFTD